VTGLAVFLLTAAAAGLLQHRGSRRPQAPSRPVRHRNRDWNTELAWQLPVFVRQLASLLRAGRTPASMWQEIGRVYGIPGGNAHEPAESGPNRLPAAGTPASAAAGAGHDPPVVEGTGMDPQAGPVATVLATALGPRIRAAGRAAELGLGVADALRGEGNGTVGDNLLRRLWTDLAACWEVSELTGAPLAVLLENYAGHLQQELDLAAARRTALAGPRATSGLLGWLPLLGLGLGVLMGVDPFGLLLGTPAGWMVLAAGAGLMVLGRFWSGRLVARAAGARDTS
jgi:tight adherence protein B